MGVTQLLPSANNNVAATKVISNNVALCRAFTVGLKGIHSKYLFIIKSVDSISRDERYAP